MDDLLLRRVRPGLGGELADVRVNDGRVTSITEPGSEGFAARVVDGHGGTLLPGLVDAHVHVVQWATFRRRVPLDAARSAGEAVELLLAHLLATPAPQTELVVGAGFRDGLWPAVFSAVLSALAFNFFFLPPLYTFTLADPSNWFREKSETNNRTWIDLRLTLSVRPRA